MNRRTFIGFIPSTALLTVASAQTPPRGTYQVERKSTTDTAEAVTVQIASGSARTARMTGATVYCSVEAEVTVERDGAAATATPLTVLKMNSEDATASATAYHSSDVGAANRTTARHIVAAGGTILLDLSPHILLAGENITIRTAHASGTVIINVQWTEY